MGEVVNPRQQANGEKEENHTQQLDEGPPWPRQDLPALEQLYEQTGKDAKLRAGWADLIKNKRKKLGHCVLNHITQLRFTRILRVYGNDCTSAL